MNEIARSHLSMQRQCQVDRAWRWRLPSARVRQARVIITTAMASVGDYCISPKPGEAAHFAQKRLTIGACDASMFPLES
ncbi:hypothetical protein [Caballeronia sp. DA-9]|uniref:hypothetical protein n=1 Tax=Caballeronia sp. DA-9 TaxID=3436237 RepID=UPI003F672687